MSTSDRRSSAAQGGFTLIELLIFIVVVGAALAGVMMVINQGIFTSADPQVRKQAALVAESMLEEVMLQPFTYCDPDDPTVTVATSIAQCAIPEMDGPQAGETRGGPVPFDNVVDYNGYSSIGVRDSTGTAVPGLEGYTVAVTALPAAFNGVPAADALHVVVTVTGPTGVKVVLDGWRTRSAPNSAP